MPDGCGYTMFHQDGKVVAAGPRRSVQDGGAPQWSTYIATDDADATAARSG